MMGGKVTKDCVACSNRKVKGGEEKHNFVVTHAQGSQDSTQTNALSYIMQERNTIWNVSNRNIL
jgi:hypothetical protein